MQLLAVASLALLLPGTALAFPHMIAPRSFPLGNGTTTTPPPPTTTGGACTPGQHQCSPDKTAIQVCLGGQWATIGGPCGAGQTCQVNSENNQPYCVAAGTYDQQRRR